MYSGRVSGDGNVLEWEMVIRDEHQQRRNASNLDGFQYCSGGTLHSSPVAENECWGKAMTSPSSPSRSPPHALGMTEGPAHSASAVRQSSAAE